MNDTEAISAMHIMAKIDFSFLFISDNIKNNVVNIV